jgi:hypothetical protein
VRSSNRRCKVSLDDRLGSNASLPIQAIQLSRRPKSPLTRIARGDDRLKAKTARARSINFRTSHPNPTGEALLGSWTTIVHSKVSKSVGKLVDGCPFGGLSLLPDVRNHHRSERPNDCSIFSCSFAQQTAATGLASSASFALIHSGGADAHEQRTVRSSPFDQLLPRGRFQAPPSTRAPYLPARAMAS